MARPDHGRGAQDATVLEALLADAGELAGVLDLKGALRYLNPAACRLLAIDDGPLPGLALADLVSEVDRPTFELDLWPSLAAGGRWSGSLRLHTASGDDVPTRSVLRAHEDFITWVARDVSAERAVYERLHRKVFQDELTGLPHRSIFLDRLDLSLRRTDPGAPAITLLFVTLDRFRERNERLSPSARDDLLREVAQRLVAAIGPNGSVARWGDEEFMVLSEDTDGQNGAALVQQAFADPFGPSGAELHLTASIGEASGAPGAVTTDQLLRQADAASQMARQRGDGEVHRYDDDMEARALHRVEVENALRGAAGRGELVVHYQPEVSLRTNEIVGAEALVRWQHPSWGLVAPGEFVPVAEASNLILEVGTWVLDAALEQAAAWRALVADRAPTVSVNISARQFEQDDFVEIVAGALQRSGAEAGDLCLEITESVLMTDVDLTTSTLTRLKALGVSLAVDDFGTGYSSLSYLRRFPVDVLKVDQSFVSGLGHDAEDSAIVQAVVHMGRALQLITVAEGVETAHHVIELRELDCDLAQGYHFARPLPAAAFTRLLEAGSEWMQAAP